VPESDLCCTATGDGPAVLWLHGYTMDSSLWGELWEALPGFRHIGVDLPGHGGSPPSAPGTTLPQLAASVADVARAQDAHRMVALSFGSLVALQLAIDEPDLLTHLALGAATIGGAQPAADIRIRYAELAMLYGIAGPGEALTDRWMTSPPDIFRGTEDHPGLRARIRDVVLRHRWTELADGAFRTLNAYRHDAIALGKISADTLVLLGQQDMPAYHANTETLCGQLPRCRAELMPDAGHLCLLEQPDVAARVLAAHLS
jgi:pimeloyl-ACP methyl ester carboxylesterase